MDAHSALVILCDREGFCQAIHAKLKGDLVSIFIIHLCSGLSRTLKTKSPDDDKSNERGE